MFDKEKIEESAHRRHIPIIQEEGLQFLIKTIQDNHAKTLLEIGTAIGYSSIMMNSLTGIKIDTLERDPNRYVEACHYLYSYEHKDDISIHYGDALEYDKALLQYQPYDMIFIDAAKAQYQKFFERYISLLKKDGIVIVDNLEFHGMIHDIEHIENRNTRALVRKIKRFKDWIDQQDDYSVDYYQVGDGICIIKRK